MDVGRFRTASCLGIEPQHLLGRHLLWGEMLYEGFVRWSKSRGKKLAALFSSSHVHRLL